SMVVSIIQTVGGLQQRAVYEIHEYGSMTMCANGQVMEHISRRSITVTPLGTPSQIELLPGSTSECSFSPIESGSTASSPQAISPQSTEPAGSEPTPTQSTDGNRREPSIPKHFSLHNFNSNYCLRISGGNDDAPAIQWECDNSANQI